MSGLLVPILVSLGVLILFIRLLRGRLIRHGPVCARCEYDLRTTTSNTCPECGADLTVTGVFLAGRQPSPRWTRTLTLCLIGLILYPVYVRIAGPLAQAIIDRVDPNTSVNTGQYRLTADFLPGTSAYESIEVLYPAHDPGLANAIEIGVTFPDASTRTLYLEPLSNPEQITGQSKWAMQTGGAETNNQLPATINTNNISQTVMGWMAHNVNLDDPWDSGRFIAARMVQALVNQLGDPQRTVITQDIQGESGRLMVSIGYENSSSNIVFTSQWTWLLLAVSWLLIMGVLFLFLCTSRSRTTSWPIDPLSRPGDS